MRIVALLLCTVILNAASVKVSKTTDTMEVAIGKQPVTALHFGTQWDKPFVYPLRTPAGVILSRGWPVAERADDSKDHKWHRGIFFGHGNINGADFWRELDGNKTGKMIVKSAPQWKNGVLSVEAELTTPQGTKIGTVREEYRFDKDADAYTIDARMSFRADAGVELKIADTEEAAFGVRLREEFRQDRGAKLLNSDGLEGTKTIWGKRAKWVDYSTTVDAKAVGLAIFDHPSNPGAPTYWHARGYALNSANAFGVRDFTGDKTKDGGMTVPAGQSLGFRYLVVMHDGDAKAADIEKRYSAFAR